MTRVVKIAALSRKTFTEAVPREQYIELCEQELLKAGKAGCDVALLPEHFDSFGSIEMRSNKSIYDSKTVGSPLYRGIAETMPGPMTERFGKICRDYHMYIIANFTEMDQGKIYNTAVILDRQGSIAGKYRKTHLCGSEKRCYGIDAGDELPVFDLDFGRAAIVICMDMYFPEVFRVLTLKGAEIIFWPHQTYGPSEETIEIQARSRALDFNCYLVGSNFASPDFYAPYCSGHALTGRAMIINQDGLIIAETGHYPGLAIADVDLDIPRIGKDITAVRREGTDDLRNDLLRFRRPALYGEIVKSCDNEAVLNGRFID